MLPYTLGAAFTFFSAALYALVIEACATFLHSEGSVPELARQQRLPLRALHHSLHIFQRCYVLLEHIFDLTFSSIMFKLYFLALLSVTQDLFEL